jgi:hypothetical protein
VHARRNRCHIRRRRNAPHGRLGWPTISSSFLKQPFPE